MCKRIILFLSFQSLYLLGLANSPAAMTCGGGVLVTKSCMTLATPWTVGCQAPLSMGFPRQEYWSGSPFSSPGDLPDPGIKLRSLVLQADSLPSELPGKFTLVTYFIHGISSV